MFSFFHLYTYSICLHLLRLSTKHLKFMTMQSRYTAPTSCILVLSFRRKYFSSLFEAAISNKGPFQKIMVHNRAYDCRFTDDF